MGDKLMSSFVYYSNDFLIVLNLLIRSNQTKTSVYRQCPEQLGMTTYVQPGKR